MHFSLQRCIQWGDGDHQMHGWSKMQLFPKHWELLVIPHALTSPWRAVWSTVTCMLMCVYMRCVLRRWDPTGLQTSASFPKQRCAILACISDLCQKNICLVLIIMYITQMCVCGSFRAGSRLIRPCQSTIVGGTGKVRCHTLWSVSSETLFMIYRDKKGAGGFLSL